MRNRKKEYFVLILIVMLILFYVFHGLDSDVRFTRESPSKETKSLTSKECSSNSTSSIDSFDIKYIPLWPYPSSYNYSIDGDSVSINLLDFVVRRHEDVSLQEETFLQSITERYNDIILGSSDRFTRCNEEEQAIYTIIIDVHDFSRMLRFGVDESYTLTVTQNSTFISAETVLGVMRGLETFSQLVIEQSLHLLPIVVEDSPRYIYRTLMLDVSNHFMSIPTIKNIMEGMSANKLNGLILNMVDDSAFTLALDGEEAVFSERGSYHPQIAVYKQDQIRELVEFGYLRGIIVIPRINIPKRVISWGKAIPEIVIESEKQAAGDVLERMSKLNTTNPKSFDSAIRVLESSRSIFSSEFVPNELLHLGGGGGGVKEKVENTEANLADFVKKLIGSMKSSDKSQNLRLFVDQDTVFAGNLSLSDDMFDGQNEDSIIVDVWNAEVDLQSVVEKGFDVISSVAWNMERLIPIDGLVPVYCVPDVWLQMYNFDVEEHVDSRYHHKILGGEARMWSHHINELVVEQRIFPQLCAIAERLWSEKSVNFVPNILTTKNNRRGITSLENYMRERRAVKIPSRLPDDGSNIIFPVDNLLLIFDRMDHHICHNLLKRGVKSNPSNVGWCDYYK